MSDNSSSSSGRSKCKRLRPRLREPRTAEEERFARFGRAAGPRRWERLPVNECSIHKLTFEPAPRMWRFHELACFSCQIFHYPSTEFCFPPASLASLGGRASARENFFRARLVRRRKLVTLPSAAPGDRPSACLLYEYWYHCPSDRSRR
jgi:hypothetical protein